MGEGNGIWREVKNRILTEERVKEEGNEERITWDGGEGRLQWEGGREGYGRRRNTLWMM